VKEQVESMDGEFLMLDFKEEGAGVGGYAKVMSPEFIKAEMALFAAQAKDVDIIITTALIPGKPAPKLITAEMVASMKPAASIVDWPPNRAATASSPCRCRSCKRHGVTIIGYTDLPSRLAAQSSQLYATNLRHLLTDMCPKKDGQLVVDFADRGRARRDRRKGHEITWPPPAPKLSAAPAAKPAARRPQRGAQTAAHGRSGFPRAPADVRPIVSARRAALFGVARWRRRLSCALHVFVLAVLRGLTWWCGTSPGAPHAADERTNAISSIIIIGAILQISSPARSSCGWPRHRAYHEHQHRGRFAVTRRMLEMFRK
jgi:NAD(P) transhydrogenase subunit alpha